MSEMYENSTIWPFFKVAKTLLSMQNNLVESDKAHAVFNKNFSHIDQIAEYEGPLEVRFCQNIPVDQTVRKHIVQPSFKPI